MLPLLSPIGSRAGRLASSEVSLENIGFSTRTVSSALGLGRLEGSQESASPARSHNGALFSSQQSLWRILSIVLLGLQ